MREVIFQISLSLDGYYEGPNGEIDWHCVDEEYNAFAGEVLRSVDMLVFGRATYQLMAGYWPTTSVIDADPVVAEPMNRLPKLVFSTTLDRVDWNNTRLVNGNAAEEIAKLKQQDGKPMAILGSAGLALSLAQHGLIDQYQIIVHPIILGMGKTLFQGHRDRLKLKLTESKTFRSGNVVLYYEPAK